jgi:hypothetical protein
MQNEFSRRPKSNSKHHRSHDLSKNAAIKALWHERELFFSIFIRFLLPFQLVSTENVNDPRASTFFCGGKEKFFKLLDSYSSCLAAEVLASCRTINLRPMSTPSDRWPRTFFVFASLFAFNLLNFKFTNM